MSNQKHPPAPEQYIIFQDNGPQGNVLYYTEDGIGTSPALVRAKEYTLLQAMAVARFLNKVDGTELNLPRAWGIMSLRPTR